MAETITTEDSERVLRAVIAELGAERIDGGRYSAPLLREIERQRAFLVPAVRDAGPLSALRLVGSETTDDGTRLDRFRADHGGSGVTMLWRIAIDRDGLIGSLWVGPLE